MRKVLAFLVALLYVSSNPFRKNFSKQDLLNKIFFVKLYLKNFYYTFVTFLSFLFTLKVAVLFQCYFLRDYNNLKHYPNFWWNAYILKVLPDYLYIVCCCSLLYIILKYLLKMLRNDVLGRSCLYE